MLSNKEALAAWHLQLSAHLASLQWLEEEDIVYNAAFDMVSVELS